VAQGALAHLLAYALVFQLVAVLVALAGPRRIPLEGEVVEQVLYMVLVVLVAALPLIPVDPAVVDLAVLVAAPPRLVVVEEVRLLTVEQQIAPSVVPEAGL
jgi:hypothetical protein